jgi:hypothetical protein
MNRLWLLGLIGSLTLFMLGAFLAAAPARYIPGAIALTESNKQLVPVVILIGLTGIVWFGVKAYCAFRKST